MPKRWRAAIFALVALASANLAACTTNPATGEAEFTPFMGPAEERALGAREHPKILAAFGGAYEERPDLALYVSEIGHRVQAATEVTAPPFVFTIINSDAVNAFALPGGYIYVTRGLMALANSEAELAGVLAHEIGHVTARHTAKRYTQSVFAQLGALAVGAATGNRMISDLARLGATLYVQGYSRQQELEADRLGVRYMARAGYDPWAMVTFLREMEAESRLARKLAGCEGCEPEASLFASHPRTAARVQQAATLARTAAADTLTVGRDIYLTHIDLLLYGDDPRQGFRRGRVFAHPELGFRFEVPPGFTMRNTPKAVIATSRSGAVIRFDGDKVGIGLSMTRYLTDVWMRGVILNDLEPIVVNGMPAATATARARTRAGVRDVRVIAIRFGGDQIYRFLILTPPAVTDALSVPLRRMTYSFRPLTAAERAALKPLRVRVREVAPGETVASLAATLPFETFREERLRVLNGLAPNEELTPGTLIKLIAE